MPHRERVTVVLLLQINLDLGLSIYHKSNGENIWAEKCCSNIITLRNSLQCRGPSRLDFSELAQLC